MASVEEWQEGGENVPASAVCPVAQIPCLEVTGPKTMMGRYQEETLGAGGIEVQPSNRDHPESSCRDIRRHERMIRPKVWGHATEGGNFWSN